MTHVNPENENTGRASGPTSAEGGTLGNTTEFVFRSNRQAEKFYLQRVAKKLLPNHRIGICMHHIQHNESFVSINYNKEQRYAWYSGLQRCGLAWVCAFCATKQSEHNRAEIQKGVLENMDKFVPMLVTLTMGHSPKDKLSTLLDGLLASYRKMQQDKSWKLLVEDSHLRGTIRALEITQSEKGGWHPHFHVLWLVEREIIAEWRDAYSVSNEASDTDVLKEVAEWIRRSLSNHYWRPALTANGFYCTDERGVDVQVGHEEIIGYIAKHGYTPEAREGFTWGVADEMTRSQAKNALAEGRTVWDLLRDSEQGDTRAGFLFQEFAEATKGKNPLRWSPGLRDLLQLSEHDNDDIVYNEPEIDWIFAMLDLDQWRIVRQNNAQGGLINIASKGNGYEVWEFLNTLPGMKELKRPFLPENGIY